MIERVTSSLPVIEKKLRLRAVRSPLGSTITSSLQESVSIDPSTTTPPVAASCGRIPSTLCPDCVASAE